MIPFVGAGPGDPRLITVDGREALEAADLVVHAGSLVNGELLETYCPAAEHVNSAERDLETIVSVMVEAHRSGRSVVRLHSGDPSVYGAVLEQIDRLADRGIETRVVPGVTAAFAASATLGTQLTLPEVANHVIITRPQGQTLGPEADHLAEFVRFDDTTVAVYLGTHAVRETMERLIESGCDLTTPVAVVYHASWPDEDVLRGTVETIADEVEAAGYRSSAVILIGEAVTGQDYDRSHLYAGWQTDEPGESAER